MPIYLKQSTASQEIPLGQFVDDTDGVTAETGLTIANTDIKIWKAGANTLASKNSGGATHISAGIYYAVLDATDTNTLGSLVIFIAVAGALGVRVECVVLAANIFDSLIGGGDLLDVETTTIASNVSAIKTKTDQITFTNANKVDASLVNAASMAQAAADKVWSTSARELTAFGFTVDAAVTDKTGFSLSTAGILAIWHQLVAAVVTAGSIGKQIKDNLDVVLSTRASQTSVDTIDTETDKIQAIKDVTDAISFTGATVDANIVDPVVVGTNNDKTGYALSSAGVDAILDDTPSAQLASVPNTTSSLRQMIQFIFSYLRNKRTVTASTETLFKEDASSTLGTATLSDTGGTVTKGEMD